MINWNTVTRFSQVIAIVLFVGVFALGFWLGGESKLAPSPVFVQSPSTDQSTITQERWRSSNALESYNINLTYPQRYTDATFLLPAISTITDPKPIAFLITDHADHSYHHIKIERLSNTPTSRAELEDVLTAHAMYDPLGEHPQSLDEFTPINFGDNEFYTIRLGLFEGLLIQAYYYISPSGIFAFTSHEQVGGGVDWMDPGLDARTLPGTKAMEAILTALSIR